MPGTLPRGPLGGQTDLVEIVHYDLRHAQLAGAERRMPKGIQHAANVPHVEPFAHDHHAAAGAPQLVVDLVRQLLERAGALREVNLQRHLAGRISKSCGGRNETDLPPHGLEHQHRIGRR